MAVPDDVKYTQDHEWTRVTDGRVTVGITDYAQDALGDIVYVDLPAVGAALTAGQALGEVESTKSVSEIFSPVTGTVVKRNDALDTAPELVNTDPYGEGWLVVVEPSAPGELEGLLDAAAYERLIT